MSYPHRINVLLSVPWNGQRLDSIHEMEPTKAAVSPPFAFIITKKYYGQNFSKRIPPKLVWLFCYPYSDVDNKYFTI